MLFAKKYDLRPADQIITPLFATGLTKHYSIYLGVDQNGIEWISESLPPGGVQLVNATDFSSRNKKIQVVAFNGKEQDREIAVARAYSDLGKPYNLIGYNCEHHASFVQTGVATSKQVGAIIIGLIVVGLIYLLINDHPKKNIRMGTEDKWMIPSMGILILILLLPAFLQGCAPTISLYDQYAYTQSTSIKVDALNIMGMATDSFQVHKKEVDNLNVELQKIYEYDKNLPKNTITTQQWEILMDPNAHLLGAFLKRWQSETKEDSLYVSLKKNQVSDAFDKVILKTYRF